MRTCSVVVVVWGDPALTDQCLTEIVRTAPGVELVVIDNTGTYAPPCDVSLLLTQETNVGCCAGKILGVENSTGEIIVTLDCDAYPHEGWLEPLLSVFDDETVGMAGPRILNRDGTLQTAMITTYHGNGSAGGQNRQDEHAANSDEDGATGAAMAIRRTAVEQCPFDPGMSSTYDDVDLSLQFREAGWRVAYVPQSTVTHGSTSTGPERWAQVHQIIAYMNTKWGNR